MRLMAKTINVVDNVIRVVDTIGNVICIDTYYCDRIVVELEDDTKVVMSVDSHNFFSLKENGGDRYVAVNVVDHDNVTDMVMCIN